MRDRLIELLYTVNFKENGGRPIEQLADHLLEGGVIVPPCKVGDTVWIVGEYRGVYCAKVRVFFFNENGVEMVRTTKCDIPFCEFGKIAFFNREEAEAAHAERGGE